MSETNVRTCPDCWGHQSYEWYGPEGERRRRKCSTCNGSGVIPVRSTEGFEEAACILEGWAEELAAEGRKAEREQKIRRHDHLFHKAEALDNAADRLRYLASDTENDE